MQISDPDFRKTKMRKAIIIGCHVNALGVIRSLSWKNFHIVAMFYDEKVHFAHTSKLVHEKVKIPHPGIQEKEFIDFLIQNFQRWKDALIIETNDDALIAISKNRDILQKHYIIATPEWNIIRKLIEKPETYALARDCNVPYPKTFYPKTQEEVQEIPDTISYPCILKPVLGHLFFREFGSKNFVVNNFDALLAKFQFCSNAGYDVMVQEIIPGPDSNIYQCMMYLNSSGDLAATFFTRKLRQNPPQFGVARVAISEEIIPQVKDFTEKMLKKIHFTGILHSEFKKDPRDGVFKLMEVNGRIARSNWLATYCGVNFPWIAYMDLAEKTPVEVKDYQKDVYWIELSKDIWFSIFRHNREHLTLSDYLQPYLSKHKTFGDISTKDFTPFLKRIAILLKSVF